LSADIENVFGRMPGALELYGHVERLLLGFPGVTVVARKTQVGFRHKRMFAWVWLPIRRVKGRPESYVVLSLGLRRKIDSARAAGAVEPYPGRWTNHLIIAREADLDDELIGWLKEAYEFAAR